MPERIVLRPVLTCHFHIPLIITREGGMVSVSALVILCEGAMPSNSILISPSKGGVASLLVGSSGGGVAYLFIVYSCQCL